MNQCRLCPNKHNATKRDVCKDCYEKTKTGVKSRTSSNLSEASSVSTMFGSSQNMLYTNNNLSQSTTSPLTSMFGNSQQSMSYNNTIPSQFYPQQNYITNNNTDISKPLTTTINDITQAIQSAIQYLRFYPTFFENPKSRFVR